MENKNRFFVALLLFTLLFTGLTFSQGDKKPTRLMIMQDVVYPYKSADYESAQKALNEFFKKNKFDMNWKVYQTDDFVYMYLVPFSDYSEIDAFNKMWDQKYSSVDQKEFGKLFSDFTGTIDHNNTIIVELNDSYDPSNAYLKPSDFNFIHWDFFEILPGKDWEIKALVDSYKKMNQDLNIPVPFKVWRVPYGEHTNSVIFTTHAKDDVDFYQHNKETDEKMMKYPGGQELYMKFFSTVKKFYHYNGKPRPELDYAFSK